jgi:hypothetical protein
MHHRDKDVVVEPKEKKRKAPSRNTFKFRPFGYKEPTKSELREMLTKAVENTK